MLSYSYPIVLSRSAISAARLFLSVENERFS